MAIVHPDLDSSTLTWCIQLLHMHRRVIMTHNLVTQIKKMLTGSKIDTQSGFHRDMMSKVKISISVALITQELSPYLCLNPICIWWLTGEPKCRGKILWIQQPLDSKWVINWALQRVLVQLSPVWLWHPRTFAHYDFFLAGKSLAAFEIFCWQCQQTLWRFQMFSVQVLLHNHPVAV